MRGIWKFIIVIFEFIFSNCHTAIMTCRRRDKLLLLYYVFETKTDLHLSSWQSQAEICSGSEELMAPRDFSPSPDEIFLDDDDDDDFVLPIFSTLKIHSLTELRKGKGGGVGSLLKISSFPDMGSCSSFLFLKLQWGRRKVGVSWWIFLERCSIFISDPHRLHSLLESYSHRHQHDFCSVRDLDFILSHFLPVDITPEGSQSRRRLTSPFVSFLSVQLSERVPSPKIETEREGTQGKNKQKTTEPKWNGWICFSLQFVFDRKWSFNLLFNYLSVSLPKRRRWKFWRLNTSQ